MSFICDFHVHLYPGFELKKCLSGAYENLHKLAPEAENYAICLTERSDCNYYRQLAAGEITLEGLNISCLAEGGPLELSLNDERSLLIYPGRQINTAERIELLALTKDVNISDGRPYQDTINEILSQGALPVVNWAPGKWFGKRGKLIKKIFETYPANKLALCDTSLRFYGWPYPCLMKRARNELRAILAGSDPLPDPAQQQVIGTYALYFPQTMLDLSADNLKEILTNSAHRRIIVGKRNNPLEFFLRMFKYYFKRGNRLANK